MSCVGSKVLKICVPGPSSKLLFHYSVISEVTSCSIEVDCAVGSPVFVAVVAAAAVGVVAAVPDVDGVRQHSGS